MPPPSRPQVGYDGYRVNLLINVNNRLVPEDTVRGGGRGAGGEG